MDPEVIDKMADPTESTEEPRREEAEMVANSADGETQSLPPIHLNALEGYSGEELQALARQYDLRLFPARSRHQHILDIVRAALGRSARVTVDGFLEQTEATAFLRLPQLNFMAVPE